MSTIPEPDPTQAARALVDVLDQALAWWDHVERAFEARNLMPAELDDTSAPPMNARLREKRARFDRNLAWILGAFLARWQALGQEAIQAADLPPDALRDAELRLQQQKTLVEFGRALLEHREELTALWPYSPVQIVHTGRQPGAVRPNRLYLDVTDANRDDVMQVWALVESCQAKLREEGQSRKRRAGNPGGPKTPKGKRWVARAREAGEPAARAEFRSEYDGPWTIGYRWWYRNVRPHLS
jgi:hypothetical protein